MDNAGEELVEGVRAFLAHHYGDDVRLAVLEGRDDGAFLLKAASAEGWFDLTIPEASGGMGLRPEDLLPSFRVFGERLVVGPFFEHMMLPGLMTSGLQLSSAQAARIARVTHGEGSLALIDPGMSIDWPLGSVTLQNDQLTGQVAWVRFARTSSEMLIVALDASGQSVLALVDATSEGINVDEVPSAVPGTSVAKVRLEAAACDVLASGAQADSTVATIRSWARITAAAELTGIARHALDLALSYIVERKQFGTPIATFQAVRHLAASAAQRVIELECLAEAAASNSSEAPSGSELELAAMSYKALADELARGVVEDSIQMHGGIGFTYQYELQWYYKRALALRVWYGDEIELYRAIGKARLAR